MDIFGIGPTELVFIILIALILLGPKDMQKTGKTIGRFLRDLTTSDSWRAFRDTSREIRKLPTRLMREANLEDIQNDVGKIGKEIEEEVKGFGTWENPAAARSKPPRSKQHSAEAPKDQESASEMATPSIQKSDRDPGKDA